MKYVLLLTEGAWQVEGDEETKGKVYGQIFEWFQKMWANGTVVESGQLQPPHTATTVVIENGESVLVDRPLLEAKEAVGGYAVIDVIDLDAALEVARSFPVPDGKVEVRPLVPREDM